MVKPLRSTAYLNDQTNAQQGILRRHSVLYTNSAYSILSTSSTYSISADCTPYSAQLSVRHIQHLTSLRLIRWGLQQPVSLQTHLKALLSPSLPCSTLLCPALPRSTLPYPALPRALANNIQPDRGTQQSSVHIESSKQIN